MNLQFAHPDYLWFLLILVPCIAWYIYSSRNRYASMGISSTASFKGRPRTFKQYLLHFLFALRMIAIAVLIIIIARPQDSQHTVETKTSGTDIVISLDISSSMLAGDFDPNRLEAAKRVASGFISGRKNDNIGLVIFAGESFTAVPMTTDHAQLINYLNEVEVGILEDNTAIGDGIATAINRLKDSEAKSKSIILLTDGSHNAGQLPPMDAAEIAQRKGIKIYTIGVGKNGNAPFPEYDAFGGVHYINLPVVIDEKTLEQIAHLTGGKYFRAVNEHVLADVFKEIDRLETSETSVQKTTLVEETYLIWAILAMCLLAFELLFRSLVLRHIP